MVIRYNGRAFTFNVNDTSSGPASSIIRGFTIRNCVAGDEGGGAIYISGASPIIENCKVYTTLLYYYSFYYIIIITLFFVVIALYLSHNSILLLFCVV